MKKLTEMFALLLLVGALAVPARAQNLNTLQVKELNANYMGERVASNDTEMMKLTYVGSSTEAFVSIRNTEITAYAPLHVIDTSFGTSGYYQFADTAYDTLGELCNAIELLDDYKCELLAGISDDAPKFLRDVLETVGSAADLKASGGSRVKSDTGGSDDVDDTFTFFERVGITPLPGRRVLLRECKGNFNVITDLKVFGKLRKYEGATDGVTRNDATVVWSTITADDTDLTVTWSDNGKGGLLFGRDEHVVIGIDNDATGEQAAANFLECKWDEI